jgi:hypothetical protein
MIDMRLRANCGRSRIFRMAVVHRLSSSICLLFFAWQIGDVNKPLHTEITGYPNVIIKSDNLIPIPIRIYKEHDSSHSLVAR